MTTDSDRVLHRVWWYVGWCMISNMTRTETVEYLARHADIDRDMTESVWERLLEETPEALMEFFATLRQTNLPVADGIPMYPLDRAVLVSVESHLHPPHNRLTVDDWLQHHKNHFMPHPHVSNGNALFYQLPLIHPHNGNAFHQLPPNNGPLSGLHQALINPLNGNIRPQHIVPMPHFLASNGYGQRPLMHPQNGPPRGPLNGNIRPRHIVPMPHHLFSNDQQQDPLDMYFGPAGYDQLFPHNSRVHSQLRYMGHGYHQQHLPALPHNDGDLLLLIQQFSDLDLADFFPHLTGDLWDGVSSAQHRSNSNAAWRRGRRRLRNTPSDSM